MNLPRITIVTPSFNSQEYITKTICSVLDQSYPNLEYLVFDGGSTDNTVNILRSFGNGFNWVSEKDKGQSDAINKGFRQASGGIVSWINSNDYYLPGAFNLVGRFFAEHPDCDFLFGKTILVTEGGDTIGDYLEGATNRDRLELNGRPKGHYKALLNRNAGWIPQQSAFWRRSLMLKQGYLDESLHYAMDYEYWLRIGRVAKMEYVDEYLGAFRLHADAKSTDAKKHWKEVLSVNFKYGGLPLSGVHRRFLKVALDAGLRRLKPNRR